MARLGPDAEIHVDEALIKTLLVEQHPDVANLPITMFAHGWDNVLARLGDALLVRLPRRELAANLVINEQRWLARLAPRLPLTTPVPVRIGQPSTVFPWPWSIVAWIDGDRWFDQPPSDMVGAARDVGNFLAAMHQPAPIDAPTNAFRGVPIEERRDLTMNAFATLRNEVDVGAMRVIWDDAVMAPPWDGPPLWLHGDMHPLNLLVHNDRVAAVIDFGDITAGDPASDLVIAWMALPLDAHPVFRDALGMHARGEHGDALWRRARGWAVSIAVSILASAGSDPTFRALGSQTLSTVLADTA
jgi:aminoglycoside phosphotransferase (APT) family kinase protein